MPYIEGFVAAVLAEDLGTGGDVVVHGHGGALEVESREGAGARFTVVLPAPDRAGPTRPPGGRARPVEGGPVPQ